MDLKYFPKLFTPSQLEEIKESPKYFGNRHPTWFPLFAEQLRTTDYRLDSAVASICDQPNGMIWLKDKIPKLLDQKAVNNASASMAEIRAYGGLLESGFTVCPVKEGETATPDFYIDLCGERTAIEVAAKHQDEEQDQLQDAIEKAMHTKGEELPQDVEHYVRHSENCTIKMVISTHQPGGKPDPCKRNDSVQRNMISRLCGIKGKEKQIPSGLPSVMIIDFTNFGGPYFSNFLSEQTAPIISGHQGLTSGAIWYAMYGWKNAPVFEEGSHRPLRMSHQGRFRQSKEKKSKLSGVLIILPENAVLLENPWAMHRLTDKTRLAFCRYPWFDLTRSICDWQVGDAEHLVALQQRMIEVFYQRFDEMEHW